MSISVTEIGRKAKDAARRTKWLQGGFILLLIALAILSGVYGKSSRLESTPDTSQQSDHRR